MHGRKRIKDFKAYLRSIYAITPTSRDEVYDQHYEIFGFDAIESKADVDAFFELLNSDAQKSGLSLCKRTAILQKLHQHAYSAVETYRITEVRLFKVLASRVRHVKCGCHEEGSYYPKKAAVRLLKPKSDEQEVTIRE